MIISRHATDKHWFQLEMYTLLCRRNKVQWRVFFFSSFTIQFGFILFYFLWDERGSHLPRKENGPAAHHQLLCFVWELEGGGAGGRAVVVVVVGEGGLRPGLAVSNSGLTVKTHTNMMCCL